MDMEYSLQQIATANILVTVTVTISGVALNYNLDGPDPTSHGPQPAVDGPVAL